jgi:hypothetical protein
MPTTSTDTMTREDRKSIAVSYFKLMDIGENFVHLFDEHAYVCFPKHAPARGIKEVEQLFADLWPMFSSIVHDNAYFNYIIEGDFVVAEGMTHGELSDGSQWRGGVTLGGRFCNVFEIREDKIQRLHIYLDPDYGDKDTERYPWLSREDM